MTFGGESSSDGSGSTEADGTDTDTDTDDGDGADGGDSAAEGDGAIADIAAAFVDGDCPFEVPAGFTPRCGTVVVPADWATGDGSVTLAVAVFPSSSPTPAEDPVIYLEGGPGSHSLDTIQFVVEDLLEPLTARGDLIFFDQRGVGYSEPQLDCSETTELTRELEDDPSIGDDEGTERFHAALAACRDRLIASGVDLTDYNSISNAADVEAIRVALGYARWNLYGVSYGTKLGLEVLRRHPAGVRSAVLDSVYPPQVDSVAENPGTFLDSYQAVIDACAGEPTCASAGDLGERIAQVVADYEENPKQVELQDWLTGETDDVFVTGDTIVEVIVGALYTPWQFTDVPELIDGLEAGRTVEISAFLGQDRTTERFFSTGMFYAIACHEEISFADPNEVSAVLPADPFELKDRFDFASNTGNLAFGTCEAFSNGQAPDVSNTAVNSDTPTLLMAGVYDPVTPVSWAEAAAETLTNSSLVVAPYASHGVSTDACGITIVIDFLDGLVAPDEACLNQADAELRFLSGPERAVELENASFEIESRGVRIETVRPADWSVGVLGGDQYRRESFLDVSELFQLAGDEVLVDLLRDFIEGEHGLTLSAPQPFAGDDTVGPLAAADLDRAWERRSASSETVTVEWFERAQGDGTVLVVLVTATAERDSHLEAVVAPALEAIEVAGL